MLSEIREARDQRRKAKDVLKELTIPEAICYLAADQMARPGRRRAARWATKKPWCDQHQSKRQRKRFNLILSHREGKCNAF